MFSFLEYLFLFLEIFKFLSYANEESNDVIDGSTKTVQHSRISQFLIECCTVLTTYDVITFLICIIQKRIYL